MDSETFKFIADLFSALPIIRQDSSIWNENANDNKKTLRRRNGVDLDTWRAGIWPGFNALRNRSHLRQAAKGHSQ